MTHDISQQTNSSEQYIFMTPSKTNQNYLTWVYWGTLISSLGTFTFPGATIGIMTQMDFPLWQIGLLMGLTRLGTLIGSFFFGDLSDKYDTKKVVLWTEVLAFILSVFLILSWRLGKDYFAVFATFVFFRFVIISIGGPGRNKLVKVFSDEYKKNHFHSGVILNLVTYGPGVVGSFLGFIAIKHFSYEWALVFDALTFIINGYILVKIIKYSFSEKKYSESLLTDKIRKYFSHKKLAVLDLLIAVPFMGTNVLMSRLSGGVGSRVPLLLMTFGLAVFISFPILKKYRSRFSHIIAYFLLLSSFIILGFSYNSFLWVFFGVLLRNISYWYIFNLYSGLFQERESSHSIASLFAARTFLGTAILGLGEILFGSIGELVSLPWDLGIRALMTIFILVFLIRGRDI